MRASLFFPSFERCRSFVSHCMPRTQTMYLLALPYVGIFAVLLCTVSWRQRPATFTVLALLSAVATWLFFPPQALMAPAWVVRQVTGQRVIVTGASQGIGRCLVEEYVPDARTFCVFVHAPTLTDCNPLRACTRGVASSSFHVHLSARSALRWVQIGSHLSTHGCLSARVVVRIAFQICGHGCGSNRHGVSFRRQNGSHRCTCSAAVSQHDHLRAAGRSFIRYSLR